MMAIRADAQVECVDGLCGRCTQIILNPRIKRVTHLVVREDSPPHVQRLVPIDQLLNSNSNAIHLRCTRGELAGMENFVKREYMRVDVPPTYLPSEYTMSPIYFSPPAELTIEHLRVPSGEIALHRGTRVQAADGPIGNVDEFLVDSVQLYLTHLVLREGHLWGKKQVMIPVWLIDHIDTDAIYLKLTKRYLGALPTIHTSGERSGHDRRTGK